MKKLSIVISAYNAEKTIEKCLKSASFADEIIFVDNESSDQTLAIAKKYTSKIFVKKNNLMLNVNKNLGFSKAIGDWILSLDSDEVITDELALEIQNILKHESDISGYYIPRKNIIFGEWIQHTGWYPDYQLRLFKKEKGSFPEKHVHESLKVEGKLEYLKENILHHNYESVAQFIQKTNTIYAPNEAEQLIANGYDFNWIDAIRFPVKEFINRFFAGKGYKDGLHGLVLSIFMAFYHFIIFANIWEKYKFISKEDSDMFTKTEKEIRKSYKEIIYWFTEAKIKSSKNVFKKSWYKVKRKII